MALRRLGTPTSQTRSTLLDAAESLMRESGYAAVTSRKLAERAGLKPQLVHYYFRTMDDLFLALLERVGDTFTRRQDAIATCEQPLTALWELISDPLSVVLSYEFVALANHRKTIQAEVSALGDRLREGQIKILARCLKQQRVGPASWSPAVYSVMLDCLARSLALETSLGVSIGHDETLSAVGALLEQLERPARPRSKKPNTRARRTRTR